jgi:hypothetical protein
MHATGIDGRPRPSDLHAKDIVHWHTTIATDDIDLLAKKLRDAHVRFVSPGIVIMRPQNADFSKGALISDPGGDAVLLIEK